VSSKVDESLVSGAGANDSAPADASHVPLAEDDAQAAADAGPDDGATAPTEPDEESLEGRSAPAWQQSDARHEPAEARPVGDEPLAGAPTLESEEEPAEPAEPVAFVEDGRSDQALDFVVDVLTSMGMDCTVDLMENGDDDPPSDIRIEINGKDSDRLIGKKGQTLGAMQFLVNRVVNRPQLPRRHILIDAGGYRTRREAALAAMALRLGEQAAHEGKIITFEPMSAQDRRVVHLALAKYPGVVTKSEGKGATRRVQIIPVRE
jgi:spoIIIJ-associated protein